MEKLHVRVSGEVVGSRVGRAGTWEMACGQGPVKGGWCLGLLGNVPWSGNGDPGRSRSGGGQRDLTPVRARWQ